MHTHLQTIGQRLAGGQTETCGVLMLGSPGVKMIEATLDTLTCAQITVYDVSDTALQELARLKHHTSVTVCEAMVTANGGMVEYHQCNQRRFNGFFPIAMGQDVLPNLRNLGSQMVKADSFDVACIQSATHEYGSHVLLVAAQGAIVNLSQPASFNVLRNFQFVLLQIPASPLFGEQYTKAAVQGLMGQAGFKLSTTSASSIYPLEDMLFERDDNALFRFKVATDIQGFQDTLALKNNELKLAQESLASEREAKEALEAALGKALSEGYAGKAEVEVQLNTTIAQLNASQEVLTRMALEHTRLEADLRNAEAELAQIRKTMLEEREVFDMELKDSKTATIQLQEQKNKILYEMQQHQRVNFDLSLQITKLEGQLVMIRQLFLEERALNNVQN